MKVYLNSINGIEDAILSMYMSKRTWNPELNSAVRRVCKKVLTPDGFYLGGDTEDCKQFTDWLNRLVKWGWRHITLLRFIDFSITIEGMHRGGQDDWDSHAQRFNNRIIRSSTRMSQFDYEMSDWYRGKILPTDSALDVLGIEVPDRIEKDGAVYVKTVNGYIRNDLKDNWDAKRGLYMLSIPSNFIFKINLTEWAHVYKERNSKGAANPEVKVCCEQIADLLERAHNQFNRALFERILN